MGENKDKWEGSKKERERRRSGGEMREGRSRWEGEGGNGGELDRIDVEEVKDNFLKNKEII